MKKDNEIKRIILSLKDKKLDGFVVIRNTKFEKYGYGELNNDELRNKYSEIVTELKEQENGKIKGLDTKEAINKLYQLGMIQYSKKDFITGITVDFDEENDTPIKFTVEYTNKNEEVKLEDCFDEDDFEDKMKESTIKMCRIYGLKVNSKEDLTDEFIQKLVDFGLIKENGLSKADESEPIDEDDIILPEPKKNKIKKNAKVKNLRVNWKAIGAILGVLTVGGILYSCSKKDNNEENAVAPTPTATIEVQKPNLDDDLNTVDALAEENIDFFADDRIEEVEEIEYIPSLAYLKPIYIDGEEDMFTYYEEPSSPYLLMCDIEGNKHYNTSYDIMFEIRNEEMENIANYTQSGYELAKSGTYIYFENLFTDEDIKDKAFVKYFSMLGNEVIKNAYITNNEKGVQDYLVQSGLSVLKLIKDDIPLRVFINQSEEYIRFSELSRPAKEMVLNIAWTNTFALNSYKEAYKTDEQLELLEEDTIPEVYYNGIWYTKANIGDEIINKANELSMVR